MARSLGASPVHPKLMSRIKSRAFPQRATIKEKGTSTYAANGEEQVTYTSLSGHTDIPAALAPLGGDETETESYTLSPNLWAVMLNGYYPAITTAHRVEIDDVIYDIESVDIDSRQTMTRLIVETVAL